MVEKLEELEKRTVSVFTRSAAWLNMCVGIARYVSNLWDYK